ncbi:hypothetical protein DJ564_08805 [Pseudomonas sp. 31-12]|uniref:Ig-like domain-containing protein n=1 Tax=Pseudomonas sp. 31-12 TaxID=2201356 RepID=UPI000D6B9F57|nr:hypothetical protein [Pseudomonas sp. 31-12]AWM90913.1 hypothetical protein DJ564_08805 [Pseudomonas sp. 31-12]
MNSPMTNADSTSNGQLVFPPEPGIGVLAVAPPYPPGYKPQSDGALGVNINMVHGDRDGLLVYILAYLNMAVGDYIRVYIETKNASVAEFSVTDAHFDTEGNAKNIPFNISAKDMEARFPPLQANNLPLWHEVTRVSGNGTEGSPPVELLYMYPEPGELDTDGGKPFNQGLKLPVASESVIDKTVIDEGMFVTVLAYNNQQISDVVVLAFGSLLLESTVTVLGDVVFELTPEMLASLPPGNTVIVRWEVFDVVENSSGWSDSLILVFKPGMVLLTAPIFEQADLDDVVHHDWLVGGPLQILVTGVFAKDDLLELTFEGITKGGDLATHTFSVTLTAATRSVDFKVPNEWVRNLIRGSAQAFYQVVRAGKTQLSKHAGVTITGTSPPLGLPMVEPLENNDTVPVDTALAKVEFAKYWPMKAGAKAELRWQTIDSDGIAILFIFRLIVTDPTLPLIFQLPAKYIAPYAGAPLTLQCTITNPGEVEVTSDLLGLKIGDEKDIVLAPPFLVGAPQPIHPLDGERTIRAEFLAAIKEDRARLIHNKAPTDSPLFSLIPLNENNRANWVLDSQFLVANQGTTIRLRWNLRRNGKKAASSPAVEIVIAPIAPEDSRLPTPRISGVSGIVEVKKLTAANELVVDGWLGQRSGQPQYLMFEGTNTQGEVVRHELLKGEMTGTERGLRLALPLAWLSNLKDETTLHIFFRVNVNREPDKETAVAFPGQAYIVDSLIELQPHIDALKDPQGRDIPQGETTIASTITVHGHASIQEQVEILVNGVVEVTVTTDANGDFSEPVKVAKYDALNTIRLRAKYGDNLTSPVRSFTLRRPLQVSQDTMNLHGLRIEIGWPRTGLDFVGNTQNRPASYGVAPIHYSSSNPAVVSVDGNGKVTGLRNGSAYIHVQDRFSTLTYYVDVKNVFVAASAGVPMTLANAVTWMTSVPGSMPLSDHWAGMERVYGSHRTWVLGGSINWMLDSRGCPAGYSKIYDHGHGNGPGIVCGYAAPHVQWNPWCARPY